MTCSHETLHELLAMKYIFNNRYLITSRLNVQLDTNSVIYTFYILTRNITHDFEMEN